MQVRSSRFNRVWAAVLVAAMLGLADCASAARGFVQAVFSVKWSGETRVTVPLMLDAGWPIVPIKVNGHDVNALVDSGGGAQEISLRLASKVAAGAERRDIKINGMVLPGYRDLLFSLGPVSFKSPTALASGDLPAGIDAVIGEHLFAQAVVEFDFDRKSLTLLHPKAFVPPGGFVGLDLGQHYGIPTTEISVNGSKPLCAIIDTGFFGQVAIEESAVKRLDLKDAPGTWSIGGIGSVRTLPRLAPLDRVRLGGRELTHIQAVRIGEDRLLRDCPLLIGMGLLSTFHVMLDAPHRKLWLAPRKSVGHAFRSLGGYVFVDADGGMMVAGVEPGSTLNTGDIVTAINGRPGVPERAPSAGEMIEFTLRGGERRTVRMR